MATILYVEINVVSIAVLFLLLHNMRKYKTRIISTDHRIFKLYMIFLIGILIFDTGMWYFDGKGTPFSIWLNLISTVCYYVVSPLLGLTWLVYTDIKVFESKAGLKKRMRIYVIPFIINAVFSIVSIMTGWLFWIDDHNVYHRGDLFLIMILVAFIYLAVSFAFAVWNVRKNGCAENKSVQFHLVAFPTLLVGVSIVQVLMFGLSIIWVTCMLLCVSIYINIQNGEITMDHLTGLYNRRQMDDLFRHKINSLGKNRIMFAVMMDLDDFKATNDTYGHQAGDRVLVCFAQLLRKSCRGTDDFIFRMGGDEYLIIGEMSKEPQVELLVKRIEKQVEAHNESNPAACHISFSMGSAILKQGESLEDMIASADRKMYDNKYAKKQQTEDEHKEH